MFDLINVFEVFLPQLLRYPNPADPLNGEAAAVLLRDPAGFEAKVKDYVKKFALSNNGSGKEKISNHDQIHHRHSIMEEDEVSSLAEYSDDDEATGLEL